MTPLQHHNTTQDSLISLSLAHFASGSKPSRMELRHVISTRGSYWRTLLLHNCIAYSFLSLRTAFGALIKSTSSVRDWSPSSSPITLGAILLSSSLLSSCHFTLCFASVAIICTCITLNDGIKRFSIHVSDEQRRS